MNNQNQISPHEAAYQLELIKNPKYDSDWIGEAAKILSNEKNTFGEEDLAKFNALQLMVMNEILSSEDDIQPVLKALFIDHADLNATQMRLYWVGIKSGLTEAIMSRFLNPEISYAKSNYAIQALTEGFTGITEYLDDFDADQIAEIYTGMRDGIDYKIYAKKEYSAGFMNFIRHAISTGMHITITVSGTTIEVNKLFEAKSEA